MLHIQGMFTEGVVFSRLEQPSPYAMEDFAAFLWTMLPRHLVSKLCSELYYKLNGRRLHQP